MSAFLAALKVSDRPGAPGYYDWDKIGDLMKTFFGGTKSPGKQTLMNKLKELLAGRTLGFGARTPKATEEAAHAAWKEEAGIAAVHTSARDFLDFNRIPGRLLC